MRFVIALLIGLTLSAPAVGENQTPYSGTKVIETGKPFAVYLVALEKAIRMNKMGIVARACATCGAKSIGIKIPGNRVIMIYNPHFAVRMLEASPASGIEAPLRLYITENANGSARLTYRLPSHVFAPYKVGDLDKMANELDKTVAAIVKMAGS